MSTTIARLQPSDELGSSTELTSRLAIIQDVMRSAMKKGQDYGTIPGTPKPTLLKPGAEKLCTVFKIAPDYIAEDLSTHDCVRIRVKCIGQHQVTGAVLGSGVGECSSNESKYKWRKPVCIEEFNETPESRRRSKWLPAKGGKPYRQNQVRTEPEDQANTVLKIAAKRAHIAMTLNVTGATAIFTQDLEDMPAELRPAHVEEDTALQDERPRSEPKAKAGASGAINDQQLRTVQRKLDDAGMNAQQLCERFNVKSLPELQFSELNTALAYIADPQMNEARP